MYKKGIVLNTDQGISTVKVQKDTMCSGCSSDVCKECIGQDSKSIVLCKAINNINAREGDYVLIYSKDSHVLLFSFLIFLVPIVLFLAAFFISSAFLDDTVSIIISVSTLVICFLAIGVGEHFIQKKKPFNEIKKII